MRRSSSHRACNSILITDLTDIDDLSHLNNADLMAIAETGIKRVVRLIREVVGPYSPNMTFRTTPRIEINGKILDKVPYNLTQAKSDREIQILERFYSGEYLFWGYWFKEFGPFVKKSEERWTRDEGTYKYAEAVTGIKRDGTLLNNGKITPMQEKISGRLDEFLQSNIDTVYSGFKYKELLRSDILNLFFVLDGFYLLLKKANKETKKTCYNKKTIKIAFSRIKEIESRYVNPAINEFQEIATKVKNYLFRVELIKGGWIYHVGPPDTPANPLNTGEVCCALVNNIKKEETDKLNKATDFLFNSCIDGCYWATTRREVPQENHFANAFVTNYLIKRSVENSDIIKNPVANLVNNIENDNIGFLEDFHYFFAFCQSVKTLANYYKFVENTDDCKNKLDQLKAKIIETERIFWEKAEPEPYESAIFATAMALIAISSINRATGDFDGDLRVQLFKKIVSHPERPLVNHKTWYPKDPSNPAEYTHWVKPWIITALAMQPFSDPMQLIDFTRDLACHFSEQGVLVNENGRYHVWAAAHLLYAIGYVINRLKKKE
jgi:hypothetical protein